MIELLNTYYTKEGEKIVVLDYTNGRYLCSYSDGKKIYLYKEEILMVDKKKKVIEPIYMEEKIYQTKKDSSNDLNKEIISSESKRTDINFEENTNMEDFDLNVVPKQQTEKDIFLQPENTRNFQENKNEKKETEDLYEEF